MKTKKKIGGKMTRRLHTAVKSPQIGLDLKNLQNKLLSRRTFLQQTFQVKSVHISAGAIFILELQCTFKKFHIDYDQLRLTWKR